MLGHATISRSGEVDFPAWVKALAWVIVLLMPIGIMSAVWVATVQWDMSERVTRMETKIDAASSVSLSIAEAQLAETRAAEELLQLQIDRNREQIIEIRERLGMGRMAARTK